MSTPPIKNPRHHKILAHIHEKNFVSNENLAQELNVTVQTIRRDLNHLSAEGLLARYHGGASALRSSENLAYRQRQGLNIREKQAIATCAAKLVPNNTSLFINIGTTTEAFARGLTAHLGLRIITNNLNVASALCSQESFEMFIAGGRVRKQDGGIVGAQAAQSLANFRAEIGVIGISGIDADGSLLDYDTDEVQCARTIIRNAHRVMLVTDHTKFSRMPMGRVGHFDDIDDLITDQAPPPHIERLLKTSGVTLHVATL